MDTTSLNVRAKRLHTLVSRRDCLKSAAACLVASAVPGTALAKPARSRRLERLENFGANLVEHGRDTYGPKQTPLFVSQLEIDTRHIPPPESTLYGQGNRGGAGPTSNNLEFDSGLVRFLDALSRLTGDPKYRQAVDEYLEYCFEHLPDPQTGFLPWGDHRGYDVLQDRTIDGYHEFKVVYPPWERYYEVNPQAVTRQIESLKRHIYDESRSWAFSRHHPSGGEIPHSMNSSGGAWIAAWAFLHCKTGEDKYLQWAERMADYFWSIRDPETSLLAAHPADPAYPETHNNERARLRASRTEYMGQLVWFAPNLLQAAELLGEDKATKYRRQALAYIRAFTGRMDVQPDGSFYATFDLETGEPLFPRIDDGWRFIPQQDERYPWANRVLGLRAPIALAFAYKMTGEEDLRETFEALEPLYRLDEFADPESPRKELPAGLMAQAIVSFLNMYQATGDEDYLDKARTFGRYAERHYLVDGWIVCGPPLLDRYSDADVDTWRTYSNRGGSAELALALLRLDEVAAGRPDVAKDNPMCYF